MNNDNKILNPLEKMSGDVQGLRSDIVRLRSVR